MFFSCLSLSICYCQQPEMFFVLLPFVRCHTLPFSFRHFLSEKSNLFGLALCFLSIHTRHFNPGAVLLNKITKWTYFPLNIVKLSFSGISKTVWSLWSFPTICMRLLSRYAGWDSSSLFDDHAKRQVGVARGFLPVLSSSHTI